MQLAAVGWCFLHGGKISELSVENKSISGILFVLALYYSGNYVDIIVYYAYKDYRTNVCMWNLLIKDSNYTSLWNSHVNLLGINPETYRPGTVPVIAFFNSFYLPLSKIFMSGLWPYLSSSLFLDIAIVWSLGLWVFLMTYSLREFIYPSTSWNTTGFYSRGLVACTIMIHYIFPQSLLHYNLQNHILYGASPDT